MQRTSDKIITQQQAAPSLEQTIKCWFTMSSRVLRYIALHVIAALFAAYSLAYEHYLYTVIGLLLVIYLLKIKHNTVISQLISHWVLFVSYLLASSYWLIYCLIDFLHISTTVASLCLCIGSGIIACLFCIPSSIYHYLNRYYKFSLSLSCLLIIADYIRLHTMVATPWLLWSNHSFNISLFGYMLPLSGFFITGYLCLKIIEMIVNVLLGRFEKDAVWTIPLCGMIILTLIADSLIQFSQVKNIKNTSELNVHLMQNNHNHLHQRNAYLDWEDYLHKIHPSKQSTLNISSEGALSFTAKEMSISEFRKMTFLKNSLIGVNYHTGSQFIPMMIGTNQVHGSYQKEHLVPFGEYFPLPDWIMKHFGYYSAHREATHQIRQQHDLIQYRNYTFYPMICYDLFFPIANRTDTDKADAIVVIAENTWYRESLLQPMFIRAAKMRALESSKPLLLVLNRGPSSHIDSQGKVVQQSAYNQNTTLKTKIYKHNQIQFTKSNIGPTTSIVIILIGELCANIYWQRRRLRKV